MTGEYRPDYANIQKVMPDSREMNPVGEETPVYTSKPSYNNQNYQSMTIEPTMDI